MKKKLIIVLIPLCAIISTTVIVMLFNPLLKTERQIRNDIIRITPIGTSMDEVLEIANSNRKWKIRLINYEQGYVNYEIYIPNKDPNFPMLEYTNPVVGEKSIRVYLGRSWTFGHSVLASWGFDSNGNLIDVYVRKTLAI